MNIKNLFINFSAAELFQLRKPFCELIIVLPPAEMWAKMQAFCRVKHLAESFPLIQNITKPKTLKVCSGCTITSPFQLHKRPLTFPFIPVTFRFWEIGLNILLTPPIQTVCRKLIQLTENKENLSPTRYCKKNMIHLLEGSLSILLQGLLSNSSRNG